jgi:gamma-glutamyl:cysteine ligase YbdK (ATP-grasp superfamily)
MPSRQFYIAVAPTQSPQTIEVVAPENAATTTSVWALVGAVILASVPQLWKLLSGQQSAQTTLTTTLLKNLNDSYQLSSVSNETFRAILNSVAERPTKLAEMNAVSLRDLLQEVADLRGQMIAFDQKLNNIATIIARQAQNKN